MAITAEQLKIAQENNPQAFVELVNGELTIVVPSCVSMTACGELGPKRELAKAIEKAMAQAVEHGIAMGIPLNNTEKYLELKIAAREDIKKQYNEYLAGLAAKLNKKAKV